MDTSAYIRDFLQEAIDQLMLASLNLEPKQFDYLGGFWSEYELQPIDKMRDTSYRLFLQQVEAKMQDLCTIFAASSQAPERKENLLSLVVSAYNEVMITLQPNDRALPFIIQFLQNYRPDLDHLQSMTLKQWMSNNTSELAQIELNAFKVIAKIFIENQFSEMQDFFVSCFTESVRAYRRRYS